MTRLKAEIAERIALDGPMPVDRYMALCLSHPTLGYYTTRDPFGAAGDFTTAPEISQVFGELIGLWAAQTWLGLGAPPRLRLVEIGPGRGTLMADALRAIARALPAMMSALEVRMVETSRTLQAAQQARLAQAGAVIRWTEHAEAALDGPVIVIANELLDALPVRQFVRTARGWHERLVGLGEAGEFAFGLAPDPDPGLRMEAHEGAVLELSPASDALLATVARHIAAQGGAALFIDYGFTQGGFGDTLQAMQRHGFVDPLAGPGEADLTTHVNFARAAELARAQGARVFGPVTQAAFLLGLGLTQRAATLRRAATPAQAAALDASLARLTDSAERGMGQLFKAIAFAHPSIEALAGFDAAAPNP
jgi:NADH dehydrogenase [ubiquinone] 1 alpha subcomplex assembly factor 7